MKTSFKMASLETSQQELKILLEFQKAIDGNVEEEIAENAIKYLYSFQDFKIGVIFLNQDGKTVNVGFYTGADSVNHPDFFNYLAKQREQFIIPATSKYYDILQSISAINDPVIIPGKWKDQSRAFFVIETSEKPISELLSILCDEFARTIAHKQEGHSLSNLLPIGSSYIKHEDGQERSAIDGALKNLAGKKVVYKGTAEKKEAKNKLRIRNTQLKDLQNALNEVVPLMIADLKGEITEVNGLFSKLTKYSKSELVGQKYDLFKSDLHSDDFYQNIWHTIKNGKIWKGEISTKDKNGQLIWLYQSIIPIQAGDNGQTVYYALGADISSQKERELQQHNAKEGIEKTLKMKEDFISIMSHELRTPLNAVLGISQLLQKVTADKNQNELIDTLNSSAKNLLNLINKPPRLF